MSGVDGKDRQLDDILGEIRERREGSSNGGNTVSGGMLQKEAAVEIEMRFDARTGESTVTRPNAENKGVKSKKEDFAKIKSSDSGARANRRAAESAPERTIDAAAETSGKSNKVHRETDKTEEFNRHPLFAVPAARTESIPRYVPEKNENAAAEKETAPERTELVFEKTEEIRRKGVLNVKDNIEDEEFKTFFSNTVVIDSKPLSQRRQRQNRVTDFVVGENGGPVLEEQVLEEDGSLSEYRSDHETEQVLDFLSGRNRDLLIRSIVTGAAAVILVVLSVLAELKILISDVVAKNPTAITATVLILMLIAVAVNFRSVFRGLYRLAAFKADADSVTSAAAVFGFLEPALVLALKGGYSGLCAAAAVSALFFSILGKKISAARVLNGFNAISADYEKYATDILSDDAFSRRLARDLSEDARILIKRKTGFTDDFLAHSKSRDDGNDIVSLPATLAFFAVLACGIISYVKNGDILSAVHALGLASALTAPFTATLSGALPIDKMQKALSKMGCVVPGFSAARDVANANCVVLEGRDVFPRGNVLLHGIKTFERERIDRAILYAASILIQSCDTMSHMFLNVIQNKTEMLYNVDNIIYEDGLGFSCWVDRTRLLIGSRELLVSRDIDVPSRDYESRYTKSSEKDAIYLAVSGKLYAMFVVSYQPGAEVERALRGFVNEGIGILIRTRDFNITAEKISRKYKIPRAMISVVSDNDMEELSKKTAYVSHTSSLFTHIGSLSSYVGGILSCCRLQGTLKLTAALELVSVIVGAVLALVVSVFPSISFGVPAAILFQLFWMAATFFVASFRKYG